MAPAPPTAPAFAPSAYGMPFQLYGAGAAAPSGWPPAAAGVDTMGMLLHALQQRQIPPLPGPYTQPTPVPQQNAMSLLSLMLSNPNLQRTLQSAHLTGVAPRAVELPVPATTAPLRTRQVQIPLGAVMNALSALAGQAMTELNESTPDDDPEMPSYLVGDDGDVLVDPASPDDRAALVAHLFRLSDEVQRAGSDQSDEAEYVEDEAADSDEGAGYEQDESEVWAAEAGFI